MSLQPPFALFVLSEKIDSEYINYSLRRAWRGNFMASWDFWVATDSHSDMPNLQSQKTAQAGTVAPIQGSFTSPWIGKTIEDCAQWLQKTPHAASVNKKYFVAMDEHSKGDDTVLVCRVRQSTRPDDIEVEFFPQPTDVVAVKMTTHGDSKFDEMVKSYHQSQTSQHSQLSQQSRKISRLNRNKTSSFH